MSHDKDLEARIAALEAALEEMSADMAGLDMGEDPFAEEVPMEVTVAGEDPEDIEDGLDMAGELVNSDALDELIPDEEEADDEFGFVEGDLDSTDDPEMLDKLLMQRLRRR